MFVLLHMLYYRPYYGCPSCGNEMAKHKRHIIHGSSAIYINMQQIDPSLLGDDDGIYTWLACKHCAQVCMQTCYMCVRCRAIYSFYIEKRGNSLPVEHSQ